jgi:hypothetical protein
MISSLCLTNFIYYIFSIAECQICMEKKGQLSQDLLCINVYHLRYGNVKNKNQKWDVFSLEKKEGEKATC